MPDDSPTQKPAPERNLKVRTATPSQPPSDARLGRIVRLLLENAMVVVSGTKIAEEIGTTRSEVWRLVQQLREFGVEIAGHPSSGYQLKSVPDLLLPEMLAPRLQGTIFGKINHYYRIGSTNTEAMRGAQRGEAEGTVYLAEQQTAGRGRGANQWHSEQSNGIYCSVILRPQMAPSEILPLSLAAGLAVRAAVREIDSKVDPDLKWPNDVLLHDKKFCGILIEMNAEVTRVRHLIVGIGINVNHDSFPEELSSIATSLKQETGSPWSRLDLCVALLKSLDREYKSLLAKPDARESVLQRFQEHSSWVHGKSVRVEDHTAFDGVTEGLDPAGFLRVRTVDGVLTILSGTVRPK
jgi:BirA family biotin operon repressor/biotin-[acetyl-CoA-carboxylase] ligase